MQDFEDARVVLENEGPSAELALAYLRIAGIYVFQLDATGLTANLVNTIDQTPEFTNPGANFGGMAFDSLAELAAAGVDAIAISTPAATHIPLALEAIGLGLAVVSDKPFALDAAQALCVDLAIDPARPILDALGGPGLVRIRSLVAGTGPASSIRAAARCLAADRSPESAAATASIGIASTSSTASAACASSRTC